MMEMAHTKLMNDKMVKMGTSGRMAMCPVCAKGPYQVRKDGCIRVHDCIPIGLCGSPTLPSF